MPISTCLFTLLSFGLLEIAGVLVAVYLRVTARNSYYATGLSDEVSTPGRSVVLGASEFPRREQMSTSATLAHLHPGRAHVWRAMGPERFQCTCGRKYLTGATEWDHLGDRERRKRISQTIGLGIIFSAMASILGLVVYLFLYFAFECKQGAAVAALSIAVLPFILMQVTFWPFVAASMWRTRVGQSIELVR